MNEQAEKQKRGNNLKDEIPASAHGFRSLSLGLYTMVGECVVENWLLSQW